MIIISLQDVEKAVASVTTMVSKIKKTQPRNKRKASTNDKLQKYSRSK